MLVGDVMSEPDLRHKRRQQGQDDEDPRANVFAYADRYADFVCFVGILSIVFVCQIWTS